MYLYLLLIIFIILLCIYFIYYNLNNSKLFKLSEKLKSIFNHTYYINLNHRIDRKNETILELNKLNIKKYNRFEAIKHTDGHIGCGKSHIELLKLAINNKFPYIVIVEDDIKFINYTNTLEKLNKIIKSNIKWDVILLGGYNNKPYKYITDDYIQVYNCQTTTGYIVNNHYFKTLLNQWEKSVNNLINDSDSHHINTIDRSWKILQKKDTFLLLTPIEVIQRKSYSDIVNSNVNYENNMINSMV